MRAWAVKDTASDTLYVSTTTLNHELTEWRIKGLKRHFPDAVFTVVPVEITEIREEEK